VRTISLCSDGSHSLFYCVFCLLWALSAASCHAISIKGATLAMPHDEIILTVSRKKELEAELKELRTVRRPEATEAIRRAREYGDLSENFEYHAAKQAQAILNGKIAELEAVLDRARVVEDDAASQGEAVGIGSIVKIRDLENEDEEDIEYTIVDAMSADPLNDKISYSSPVGESLMRKKLGDVVDVKLPNGIAKYEIIGIRYV
jgi:transcription elongation factor GreA